MRFKFLKIIFFLCVILYNLTSYSKATISNNFNQKYLSSYFSALLSYDIQKNSEALKYFEASKALTYSYKVNDDLMKKAKELSSTNRNNFLQYFHSSLQMKKHYENDLFLHLIFSFPNLEYK